MERDKMLREIGVDPDWRGKELEELACAVADAWIDDEMSVTERARQLLDRLDFTTRGSALRKVLP